MKDKQLIFIGGLHRSGTSLLHEILRSHPAISGFSNTGVPEDEGQHLQSVYPPAKAFGGPGQFCFNEAAFMDENHPLATLENSALLWEEWRGYWDLRKDYVIEKSPPNLVRTRFLQQLFPQSIFIIIYRHPLAVAYATKKWSKNNIPCLIDHTLTSYERFWKDMRFLKRVYVLRYEDFVLEPRRYIHTLLDWIGIESHSFKMHYEVRPDVNDKYFALWYSDQHSFLKKLFDRFYGDLSEIEELEERANTFGYSLLTPKKILPFNWIKP